MLAPSVGVIASSVVKTVRGDEYDIHIDWSAGKIAYRTLMRDGVGAQTCESHADERQQI